MNFEKRVRLAGAAAAVGVLLVSSPLPASAQDMHWRIGGGAGYRPDYEGSNDYEPFPIGFLRMDWESGPYFAVRGTESAGAAVRLEGNVLLVEQDESWLVLNDGGGVLQQPLMWSVDTVEHFTQNVVA